VTTAGSFPAVLLLDSWNQKPRLLLVLPVALPELGQHELLLAFRLEGFASEYPHQRNQASPFTDEQCRSRSRQQQPGVDRMAHICVRAGANQLMVHFSRHAATPIRAKDQTRPDRQRYSRRS